MNEPRVYKNSPFLLVFVIIIFGILFIGLGLSLVSVLNNWLIMVPVLLLFGILFIVLVLSSTAQTIISDDEITSKNLLGTKTLKWSEISRVSGAGNRIKLHNFDGDVTVAPQPQLPGYPEVVEWIGTKRADLFNPQEYSELSRNWLITLLFPLGGLLIIGTSFFAYTVSSDSNETLLPYALAGFAGLFLISMVFTSPQSISMQGNSMVVKYLLNQKTLLASEVASVRMGFTQTRNGKHYFILINQTNGKNIRLSGLRPSLPVAYLVLKTWHEKNSSISQIVPN